MQLLYRILLVTLLLCGWPSLYGQMARVKQLEQELPRVTTDTARLRVLMALSTSYSSVDPSKKMSYARKYGRLARKMGRDSIVAESFIDIGISHGIRSRMDSAMFYFKRGLEIADRIHYVKGRARALACIGYTYDMVDNSQEAIRHYKEALVIYKKLRQLKGINQCLTNIGSLYFDMEQYTQARSYFSKVLDSYTSAGDDSGIAYALYTLGNADLELKRFDLAAREYEKSLVIRTRLGDVTGSAMTHWGLAKLAAKQNKLDIAKQHLDEALTGIRKVGDPYQESAVLLTYSQVRAELGDYKGAERDGLLALKKARYANNKSEAGLILKQLSDINEASGNTARAFRFLQEHVAVRDSINEEKARQDVVQAEFERIQSENDDLEKHNRQIVSRNTNYVTTIVIISVSLALMAILFLLYYRRNKENQTISRILAEQKEEIASINAELESQVRLSEQQNQELERLNDVKNKFFSIVSHDLRSPMSTLQMLFSLYREGHLKEMDVHDTLLKLEDTIYSTNEFLDNLLEWAKNQLEGITVRPETFALRKLADKNIRLNDPKIRIKKLEVENAISEDCMAYADPNMVDVIMRNLLSNSVKFCRPGDAITLGCGTDGDTTTFFVTDTGPGMNETQRRHIFSLEEVTSSQASEKSHHIGLVLCRDMAERNGGCVRIESETGKGTTIFVTLPNKPQPTDA
ncbi:MULTISPECIES: tetratricopeptide repeat-containing sensor histidine kinase [unclassified Flavobacterium]|uniref:ATP-binding protein n=1 Tax=unclassified Flavobacterium TaxID=196869 RepID=UPI001F146909|nr:MULTISPECIES: tetratricopeptide repeat-containing sensor histidine kinase [unclassified Flavobacterium]UMY67141.1 tetratricopeptide repeat protein [Flavobacterium sp. HJ-32-4]